MDIGPLTVESHPMPEDVKFLEDRLLRLSHLDFYTSRFKLRPSPTSFTGTMAVKSRTRAMKGPTHYRPLL
jgi:hypothetical protein